MNSNDDPRADKRALIGGKLRKKGRDQMPDALGERAGTARFRPYGRDSVNDSVTDERKQSPTPPPPPAPPSWAQARHPEPSS